MKKLTLIILLVMMAGIAKGVMDKLDFHYNHSIFKYEQFNEQWWNPKLSWRNKYKNGNPEEGVKFPFAKSALVYFTDAWHFFSMIREMCWVGAIMAALFYVSTETEIKKSGDIILTWQINRLNKSKVALMFFSLLAIYGLVFYYYFHYILEI